jgi:hypothetical protein
MKNLNQIIQYLYPEAKPLQDYTLQDNSDGRGPFIAHWDEQKLGPRPSLESLALKESEAVAALSKKAEQEAIDKEITTIESSRQARAIREAVLFNNKSYLQALETEIGALRAKRPK